MVKNFYFSYVDGNRKKKILLRKFYMRSRINVKGCNQNKSVYRQLTIIYYPLQLWISHVCIDIHFTNSGSVSDSNMDFRFGFLIPFQCLQRFSQILCFSTVRMGKNWKFCSNMEINVTYTVRTFVLYIQTYYINSSDPSFNLIDSEL